MVGEHILIQVGDELIALRTQDGQVAWRGSDVLPKGTFEIRAKPLGSDILIRASNDVRDEFLCIDPSGGRRVWNFLVRRERIADWHMVGKDVMIATFRNKGRGEVIDNLYVVDGRTGRLKITIDPSKGPVREALAKVAPSAIDQVILFGRFITKNGGAVSSPDYNGDAWIVGDHLYTWVSVEDYPELGSMSGYTALHKYRLSDVLVGGAQDVWNGQLEGRHYYARKCQHFGPLIGAFQDNLLTTFTNQTIDHKGDLRRITTLVAIPEAGEPVVVRAIGRVEQCRAITSLGTYLWKASEGSILLTSKGPVEQPLPDAKPIGKDGWGGYEPCLDGVVYSSTTTNEKPQQVIISLQPYRLK